MTKINFSYDNRFTHNGVPYVHLNTTKIIFDHMTIIFLDNVLISQIVTQNPLLYIYGLNTFYAACNNFETPMQRLK